MSNRKARPASAGRGSENENNTNDSLSRRRSPRFSDSLRNEQKNQKQGSPKLATKRSITVRKIAPRKTQVTETPTPSVRRSPRVSSEGNKENISRLTDGKSEDLKKSTCVPPLAPSNRSTILPPPIETAILAVASSAKPQEDTKSLEWSQKVRRSYSRLSCGDRSFQGLPSTPATERRNTLFGFEQLETPPVAVHKAQQHHLSVDSSLSALGASFSLMEATSSTTSSPEPDLNIPGVAVVKEKRKRLRVQQITMSELDVLAAKMNAEFEEAENFDLVVE